ncbi:hypothetical protein FQZ97_537410 [compost metagenome]
MGSPVPKVDSIVRAAPPAQDILEEFWHALTFLDGKGADYNHAHAPNVLAINLQQLAHIPIEHD